MLMIKQKCNIVNLLQLFNSSDQTIGFTTTINKSNSYSNINILFDIIIFF